MKLKLLDKLIMLSKLSLYGLVIQCFMLSSIWAEDISAQKIQSVNDVTVEMGFTKAKLEKVFKLLENQTDFHFSYSKEDIDPTLNITFEKGQTHAVRDVLMEVSKKSGLRFRQVNRNIIVQKGDKVGTNESVVEVFIKDIGIEGKITDENGDGLPGASVVVKGTTQGTTSDIQGNYKLNVPEGATITISFVGYSTQELVVGNQSVIDVQMQLDAEQLEEVIITGYSTERKVDLTGAVAVVEFENIEGQSKSSGNPMQALQGRVAGLYIEKSGDPTGMNNRILIRGTTTLGNNEPLYVIDGIPTKRQQVFASLNPNTIESIQVLKDASASSIYGSRAANGVIVVTTKNGSRQSESLEVSINSSVSVLSEKRQRYEMLNTSQLGEVLWRASVNDGDDPAAGFGEIFNFDWNGDFNNPVLNSVTAQPFVGGNIDVPSGDTDWQDETYETGYVVNNEITISSNNQKSNFLVSLGHLKNTGILAHTGYERHNAKINGSMNLFKNRIKVGVNTQISNSNETLASRDVGGAPVPTLAINYFPTIPVFDNNGEYAGPLGAGYTDRNNPVLMQFLNRWDNTNRTMFFSNVFAELSINENLKFRSNLGIDYNTVSGRNIERLVNNGFVNRTFNRLIVSNIRTYSLVFSNTLNYQFEIGDHRIGALVGLESIKDERSNVSSQGDDFAIERESYFLLNSATGARTSSETSTGTRLFSQFAKFNYSFSNKYLASFTIRRDGSSRFGKNNRFGVFPAISVGWRVNEEGFLRDVEVISQLKLRASYGEVGNQEIGDLARFGLYNTNYGTNAGRRNTGTAYAINGQNSGNLPSGFVSVQAPNPDLKWETTKELNMGVDFALFNAILGSIDVFQRETSNILTTPPIASAVGEGQQRVLNGASTKTKGWELSLSYSKDVSEDFYFGVSSNFGAFKDEIVFLPEEVLASYPGTSENSILGHSQFSVFAYRTNGLFQSQGDADNHPSGGVQTSNSRPGGIKIIDINSDGVINSEDRDFIGNTLPNLEYGLRVDLAYKNFDFSLFGSGVAGRIGQDYYITINNFVDTRANSGKGVLDAWTPENSGSEVPALSVVNNFIGNSDYLYRSNSYFKFRNIQLGYTLATDLVEKLNISTMRIYLQGENLFWITPKDYIGSDPERTDGSAIPVPSVFTVGLNINF